MSDLSNTRFVPGFFPAIEENKGRKLVPKVLVGDRFGRWLIVGALIVLLLETFVAGRLTSRVSVAG